MKTRWAWLRHPVTPGRWVQAFALEQRRGDEGWKVLVTWWDDDHGRVLLEWKPADQLRPVEVPHPPMGTAYG